MEAGTNPSSESPRRKRRFFAFSLRTLLVFVLISGMALGWLARRLDRKRREREAAAAIEKLGGEVIYDYQVRKWEQDRRQNRPSPAEAEPSGPAWLRMMLGQNFFNDVELVNFLPTVVAGLPHLTEFHHLQGLSLDGPSVTDSALDPLGGLTDLRQLCLASTRITDAGLDHVSHLTLVQGLSLDNTQITDAGLKKLDQMPQLELLCLRRTQVTDAGLEFLVRLPKLKQLMLTGTSVTDEGVKRLQQALPQCEISR